MQAGVAATLAWFVGAQFLDNPSPVLAPTTAVGIVAASMGSTPAAHRRVAGGGVLGLAVGQLLMSLFGIGPWQTGLVVVLAIIVAVLLKGGGSLLTQAGGTAVLIATLEPPVRELSVPRFVDSAVGGAHRSGGRACCWCPSTRSGRCSGWPNRCSTRPSPPCTTWPRRCVVGTLAAPSRVWTGLRILGSRMTALDEGLGAAQEVVRLAPLRWHQRKILAQYTRSHPPSRTQPVRLSGRREEAHQGSPGR